MYMHCEGLVHGDLKGVNLPTSIRLFYLWLTFAQANILIDRDGHARLADFGFTTIVLDFTQPLPSSSSTDGGTTRWMSPERLNPDLFGFKDTRPTKKSDCYALGMVILEVLSGQIPFKRDRHDYTVMREILEGEHPERPQEAEGVWFTDDLWGMLEWCWSRQPEDRPTVEAIFSRLDETSTAWRPLSHRVDGNAETDACRNDWSGFTASGPGMFPIVSQVSNSPRRVVHSQGDILI